MKDVVIAPDILLPKQEYDYSKWATVACDQFTSQPSYWEELDSYCGDVSALRLIYPEAYLNIDQESRLKSIRDNMHKYESDGVFDVKRNSMILVERTTANGLKRIGIMLAIDLDQYEYKPKSDSLIRATELTVEERLPIRVKIRANAPIELPHVMLLMDDRECTVIEPIYAAKDKLEKIYDFELNMNGGHLVGYLISDTNAVLNSIYKLLDAELLRSKYGIADEFLFAVGDGNHSLAAAKLYWESVKKTLSDDEIMSHPARYALVELVNLHCNGLLFEPIHRVIFGADESFLNELKSTIHGTKTIRAVYNDKEYIINCDECAPKAILAIQSFIDNYISSHSGVSIDYIHGDKHLLSVAEENHGIALFMPTVQKNELFRYVIENGSLPRKAFSMGDAEDKRYYTEARKIVKE